MIAPPLLKKGIRVVKAEDTEHLYDNLEVKHCCVVLDLVPESSKLRLEEDVVNIKLWMMENPGTFSVFVVPAPQRELAKRLRSISKSVTVLTEQQSLTDAVWAELYATRHADLEAALFVDDLNNCAQRITFDDNWKARMLGMASMIMVCREESSVQEIAVKLFPPRKGCAAPKAAARQKLHKWTSRTGAPSCKTLVTLVRIGWILKYLSLGYSFGKIAPILRYSSYNAMRASVRHMTGLPLGQLNNVDYDKYVEQVTILLLQNGEHDRYAPKRILGIAKKPGKL